MKKIALLIFSIILPVYSNAAVTKSGEVSRIYASGNTVHFRLKNDTSCNPNNKYYIFSLDTEVKKSWYALLLAAANTGKPISVSVTQCPTDNHEVIRYLYQDF